MSPGSCLYNEMSSCPLQPFVQRDVHMSPGGLGCGSARQREGALHSARLMNGSMGGSGSLGEAVEAGEAVGEVVGVAEAGGAGKAVGAGGVA